MASEGTRTRRGVDIVVRSIIPVVLALIVAAIILLALGKNPLYFYGDVFANGILGGNWQNSLVVMTPMLLIAVGLIVVFRGQLWNLGYDGQYLLGAVFVGGLGPQLAPIVGDALTYLITAVLAILVGAVWTLLPAWLKARFGTNEVITTLVMSSIGVGATSLLIGYVFQDPSQRTPQTRTFNTSDMLPYIPGTTIHIGFIVAIVVALAFQFILSRTSFGLRLDIYGASPKAARHVGINSRGMTIVLFLISGGLIGLAAAMDILGHVGYVRNNWNPAYGDTIMPFVFLARLSPLAAIPFVAFYAIFATGGTVASIDSGLSTDFLMVIVALILVFMTLTEYIGTKRDLGQSYLPDELRDAFRRPFDTLRARSAK